MASAARVLSPEESVVLIADELLRGCRAPRAAAEFAPDNGSDGQPGEDDPHAHLVQLLSEFAGGGVYVNGEVGGCRRTRPR